MKQYLDWLRLLASLRDKLPPIFAALQALVKAINDAFPAPTPGILELNEITPEVEAAEAAVVALVAGENAAFDGSRLRAIYTFLKETGLLDIFTAILLKKLAGG